MFYQSLAAMSGYYIVKSEANDITLQQPTAGNNAIMIGELHQTFEVVTGGLHTLQQSKLQASLF